MLRAAVEDNGYVWADRPAGRPLTNVSREKNTFLTHAFYMTSKKVNEMKMY